jgi:penicillin amidase
MDAEWAAYGADAKAICTSFAAGVNGYIELVEADAALLPPEFTALGTKPARWSAEDILRIRSHSVTRNALSEVIRANVLKDAEPAIDLLRQNLEPAHNPLEGGSVVEDAPIAILDMFKLAVAPVTFSRARLDATLDQAAEWRKITALNDVVRTVENEGSNNWVVDGSRTDTGRPILASDPHRPHSVPSLRYIVHLKAPGFDGIGAGEPALPGISMGHNGKAAFALTLFFGHDQEDVYLYDINPDNAGEYRYGAGWEAVKTITETFAVRGYADVEMDLQFTRHGPLIWEDKTLRKAAAIRSVWFEPGSAPYFASISSMRSQSFAEFQHHMERWGVPATNQLYADTDGDIGWLVAGQSPVRPNWDGLMPVSGDGRFEWNGLFDPAALPSVHKPAKGYFATANEFNMPADWPHDEKPIGYEWTEASRAQRIENVLSAQTVHTMADSAALQADLLSLPAERLQRLLAPLAGRTDVETAALQMLSGWNCRLDADSGAAALFEVWWTHHLRPSLFSRVAPNDTVKRLLGIGDATGVLNFLEQPTERLDAAARDDLLRLSLAEAYAACGVLMGSPGDWQWGKLHKAYFEHAVTGADAGQAAALDVGPIALSGADATVMKANYRPHDFRLTNGASFRMLVDVGDWDNCVCINTPGQSGDPRSPHYDDLAHTWSEGGFVPMLYSTEAIAAAAETRITLKPKS